ncbi:MAG: radical SAM protein [Deltaproteobacteria bacterium]|nr:radical SAM protein [Deltaproteobacteria bacterium]
MRIAPKIESILDKALATEEICREEALELMKIDENSHEIYALMSVANILTRQQFGDTGEVYAQVGINLWPCPKSCAFCSFGEKWRVIKSRLEFSLDEVVLRAKAFEEAGANAIFLMTTADYPFERYIKIARAVREALSPNMPMVANIGDFGSEQAEELLNAGFQGVYHVCRLREGKDSEVYAEVRLETLKAIRDSDLTLSYCVEPIGPEHSPEELIEEMFRGKEYGAVNHACMWRVPVQGVPLAKHGKISGMSLAKAVAITRIVVGNSIRAMGVHEPRVLSLRAGANQIYAETGPNPRDTIEDTSKGIGFSVEACKNLLKEAGYTPLEGPTKVFRKRNKEEENLTRRCT